MKNKNTFKLIINLLLLTTITNGVLYSCLQSSNNSSSSTTADLAVHKSTLEAKSLIIGILTNPDEYEDFKNYLKFQFPNVDIKVESIQDSLNYQESRNRIAFKKWDIVFSYTPMNAVAAVDNDYTWVGRMFPNDPPFFQAALFVKKNSEIKSIQDIKPNTVVVLGNLNSASGFYVPAYDLYGKTFTAKIGNRTKDIIQQVESGQADVGAVVYDRIKDNPNFTIIHRSKNITGAGVFLSPNLSATDAEKIKTALLNAPKPIRDKANYGEGTERDYSTFESITRRTEEILQCTDFNSQPVKFFCSEQASSANRAENKIKIVGNINGSTIVDNNTTRLNLKGDDKKDYQIFISPKLLNQIPNAGNSIVLQNRQVKVVGVVPEETKDGIFKLLITQPNQLEVLP